MRRGLLWVGFLALGLVLIDYATGFLVRLSGDPLAPRTNPLTFLSLSFCLAATLHQRPLRVACRGERALWGLAMLTAALFSVSDSLSAWVFGPEYLGETDWKTTLAVCCLAMSQLVRSQNKDLGLAFAALSLIVPSIAINGYLLGVEQFFGEMSVATTLILLPLALANLLRFSRHRLIAPILRQSPGGQILRLQILIWSVVVMVSPLTLRMELTSASGFYPFLQTLENGLVLAGMLYVGNRWIDLHDRQHRTKRALLSDLARDPLTVAGTRKAAVDAFLQMRSGRKIGLVLLDIDHFKSVNDTHGHSAGDRLLCALVRRLRQELRITDILARWGGEEFLIMVRVNDENALQDMAERLRKAVHDIAIVPGGAHFMTASFGAVLVDPGANPNLKDCIAAADNALYQAKAAGRDTVVMASLDGGLWQVPEARHRASAARQ
ncbi:GGDEF domain-containing protein [Tropicibacter oceani]|uniref:diguanylate cyclase n=1 Tax=Tropicibacter oceani TaxID=3058420 RepID=A0ABY8QDQ2_9RHOB|nr:GGDEF domain-containing protein [Tropicibacter oceani]WGW02750.1 GGDEF domain-containing protein [Tropicibacter oceani]